MPETEQKTTQIGDTKITLAPSAQIVKASAVDVTVTDALGRVIRLKKPNPLANLDFAKAAGGERLNMLYLTEVAHLKFVAGIDGEPVATPRTDGELRALYQRLGDEGNEAAAAGVMKNFVKPDEASAEAELKNS